MPLLRGRTGSCLLYTSWTAALVNPDSRLNLSGSASPVAALGILVLRDEAVGVSGDYQQYAVLDGEVYAHILDPDTGYPARFVRQVCVLTRCV